MESVRSLSNIHLSLPASFRLASVGLLSLFIYILAFLLPANLLTLYDQPRLDAYLLFRQGTPAYLHLILAFVILGLLYWGGYHLVSQHVGTGRVVHRHWRYVGFHRDLFIYGAL